MLLKHTNKCNKSIGGEVNWFDYIKIKNSSKKNINKIKYQGERQEYTRELRTDCLTNMKAYLSFISMYSYKGENKQFGYTNDWTVDLPKILRRLDYY